MSALLAFLASLLPHPDGYVEKVGNRLRTAAGGGGGGGASALVDLTDVDIDSPSDGEVLTYDATLGKWVNETPNRGQAVSVFVVGVLVNDLVVFPTIANGWQQVDYV